MTRTAEDRVPLAIDLGWRMAELFALNVEYEPSERTWHLLPSRSSLSRRDRLELELLAAAGTARRLGVDLPEEQLNDVRALAERAAARKGAEAGFRDELERCHIALDKQLWTHSEAEGRAYELGIMLSDTYNRICRVYHEHPQAARQEWLAVFSDDRTRTLKTLLDNLQSRLNPGAVAVVRDHVDAWQQRVRTALADESGTPVPSEAASLELRSQATVWRQLLTGDKEPEAFLGPQARARVRDELLHLMWRRYRRWVIGLSVLLFAVCMALLHVHVGHLYSQHKREAAIVTSALVSLTSAIGLSKASINRAIKENLRTWSTLLWNRALARVVCAETLRVDWVFPEPTPRRTQVVYACRQRLESTFSDSTKSTPSATPAIR
ncbi:MAG TPA: hypothetical protein VH300_03440 [Thermoleophilaceae bacterium]|jgi:hypothetical protein|nr:hypothetical protein [Thermoleophilaceae bacterium]